MTHKNSIPVAALIQIGAIKDCLINSDIHDRATARNVRETVTMLLEKYEGDAEIQDAIREVLNAMFHEMGIDPINDIFCNQKN